MNRIGSVVLIGFAVSLGASCDSEPIAEPEYRPPVAEAGPHQIVRDRDGSGSEPVVLDASASQRGSRPLVRYEWTEAGTPLIGVTSDAGRSLHVDVDIGRHWFVLTVTDDTGRSDRDTTVIEVRAPDPIVGIPRMVDRRRSTRELMRVATLRPPRPARLERPAWKELRRV